jgi:hypothetical protein
MNNSHHDDENLKPKDAELSMKKSYYRKLHIYAVHYFSHGIPNKTHKLQKHRAHLKVPTILVLSSFTSQKSKSH